MKLKILLISMLMCLVTNASAFAATLAEHEAEITATMHQQWDKPNLTLQLPVIVVEENTAIVDWIQGDKGGRALLKYDAKHAAWLTLMCGGAELTDARRLQHAGLTSDNAKKLVQSLRDKEQMLNSIQKAHINSFQGVMQFTQEQAHHGVEHGH